MKARKQGGYRGCSLGHPPPPARDIRVHTSMYVVVCRHPGRPRADDHAALFMFHHIPRSRSTQQFVQKKSGWCWVGWPTKAKDGWTGVVFRNFTLHSQTHARARARSRPSRWSYDLSSPGNSIGRLRCDKSVRSRWEGPPPEPAGKNPTTLILFLLFPRTTVRLP